MLQNVTHENVVAGFRLKIQIENVSPLELNCDIGRSSKGPADHLPWLLSQIRASCPVRKTLCSTNSSSR